MSEFDLHLVTRVEDDSTSISYKVPRRREQGEGGEERKRESGREGKKEREGEEEGGRGREEGREKEVREMEGERKRRSLKYT